MTNLYPPSDPELVASRLADENAFGDAPFSHRSVTGFSGVSIVEMPIRIEAA